jgi:hypothetical protein
MTNIIKLFDNIASTFNYSSGTIVPSGSTPGYNPINNSHINSRVSYLARNIFNNGELEFESGIGTVVSSGAGIAIQRGSIVSSSNSNNTVSFSTAGSKAIYIVPNEVNSQNAFNNFVSVTGNFSIPSYRTTYLVDLYGSNASGSLPPATLSNAGLIVDFKTINTTNSHSLHIKPSGSQTIDDGSSYTVSADDHNQFISTGSSWLSLEQNIVVQSGSPQGSSYSLQVNNGSGGFGGSNLYTNANHDLLIGDDSDYTSILRASGHNEFNVNNNSYNFIVNGKSGKNLFFDSDGKLGLNMPSNYVPQVPLHIFQNACSESIRVENRHSTNPSVLTLYHRPTTVPVSGDIPAIINLAGKNETANQVNYVSLKSKILDSSTATSRGSLLVDVIDNNSSVNIADLGRNHIKVGYGNSTTGDHVVVGKNNTVTGSNNAIFGNSLTYSGNNSIVIGKNNDKFIIQNNSIEIQNSGSLSSKFTNGNLGVGKTPTVRLDVNGEILTSGIISDVYKFSSSYTNGQVILASGQNIYASNININDIIVGNSSGLVVKNGDVSASGLSNIYIDGSGLNIDTDVLLPNLSNDRLLTLSNSKLTAYSSVSLNESNITFNKKIRVNTNTSYTVDGSAPDIFTEGYVVTSGLVVDRNSAAPSGAMLVHMGDGLAKWKTLTGYDLMFNGADITWNKYPTRNATINSSTQITITDSISAEEFLTGDTISVTKNNTIYYTTITSQSVVAGNTVLLVATMGVSSGVATIYSTTRGAYLSTAVDHGPTTNRFSIRPGTSTLFNSDKAEVDFGIYGSSTNYALYINANYNDNSKDESQVVVNGAIPYNISETQYATLTVNGYLYAEKIKVSGDVFMDCGVIVFTGVAP